MTKIVTSAEAKAHLSELVGQVAYGGDHVIIERRGKPVAALVSVAELERLEQGRATSGRPRGALALLGAWRDVGDEIIDAIVADIYAHRELDKGRPVELEE
ncbi:MAG: type II toxin-antitoxin system Phd/YefM family antitoxin [Dehalococcoidia bacterium]|nr:type II toxin-antitoxin system Phd/YefM family antitoxin [Dehalococcoidia bacterium]